MLGDQPGERECQRAEMYIIASDDNFLKNATVRYSA